MNSSALPAEERMLNREQQLRQTLATAPVNWVGLQMHLRARTHAQAVREIDFSGFRDMTEKQWRWFCGDVLPQLSSLEKLFLSKMSLSDQHISDFWTCLGGRQRGSTSAPSEMCLPNLTLLDVSNNRLTSRSALPLGKLLLKSAGTLREVSVSGNNLQDYGFQVLSIYLSKLRPDQVLQEPGLFSSPLVESLEAAQRAARVLSRRGGGDNVAAAATPSSVVTDFHIGPFIVDARNCNATVRGMSELMAAASRTTNTEVLLLSHNGALGAAAGSSASFKQPAFSNFEQLEENDCVRHMTLTNVPLSRNCSPSGCRQLFYNLFFRCRRLDTVNLGHTFLLSALDSNVVSDVIARNMRRQALQREVHGAHSVEGWYLFLEEEGETLFTLDNAGVIGGQVSVGDVFFELLAQTAFNARAEARLCPPAYVFLRELHLSHTGLTDSGVRGLCIALRTVDVTAACQNLAVLDLSHNLLSVMGCSNLMHNLVTNSRYEVTTLVSLSLQGNAGVSETDHKALEIISKNTELALFRRRGELEAATAAGVEHSPLFIEFGPCGYGGEVYTSLYDPESGEILCSFPGAQQRVEQILGDDAGSDSYRSEEEGDENERAVSEQDLAQHRSMEEADEKMAETGHANAANSPSKADEHADAASPSAEVQALRSAAAAHAERGDALSALLQVALSSLQKSLISEERADRRAVESEERAERPVAPLPDICTDRPTCLAAAATAATAEIQLKEEEARCGLVSAERFHFAELLQSRLSFLSHVAVACSGSDGAGDAADADEEAKRQALMVELCEELTGIEQAKGVLEEELGAIAQSLVDAATDLADQETLLLRESERSLQMLRLAESESSNRLNSLLERCVTVVERGNSRIGSSFAFPTEEHTPREAQATP